MNRAKSLIEAVDIHGSMHDVDKSEIQWRPSVYGIVVCDGKILLSPQHNKGHDLPGGGVDIDESFEDAVVREVREETGIEVAVGRVLAVRDNIFKVTFREPQEVWHSVMVYYLCDKIGGELSDKDFDQNEKSYAGLAQWVDVNNLDSITPAASYDYRDIIKEALNS